MHNYFNKKMAIILRTKETISKFGNLKNLNLAILDSRSAMAMQKTKTFNRNIPIPKRSEPAFNEVAIPHGKNKLDPSAIKIMSLFADAHSINASFFPEYSKIIAS